MALADLLQKAGDFLRSVAEMVLQMLMEADVESQGCAAPLAPSPRKGWRKGHCSTGRPPCAGMTG